MSDRLQCCSEREVCDRINGSGMILFGVRREVTVVRLIFLFYTPWIWDVSACPRPPCNGRKLDSNPPRGPLFPWPRRRQLRQARRRSRRVSGSGRRTKRAQSTCMRPPPCWNPSDVPLSSFYLATRVTLRSFFIGYPLLAPLSSMESTLWDSLTVAARRLVVTTA